MPAVDRPQAIRSALEMDPDVQMVTSYLLAYEFLDENGKRCIGFTMPSDQSTLATHALGVAAARVGERILDNWLDS